MTMPGATSTAGDQTPASPAGTNPVPTETVTPQTPGGAPANDDVTFEGDENQWDEKTKAYILRLRKENGKYRTKAKAVTGEQSSANVELETFKSGVKKLLGLETDISPEEQVQMLDARNQQSEFRSTILELALEHEIPKSEIEFFEYRLAKIVNGLAEGEEVSEEAIGEIIAEVKTRGGVKAPNGTSVPTQAGQTPAPGQTGEVTLEQFSKMNIGERSLLHGKNPALYTKLFQEAKLKRLL